MQNTAKIFVFDNIYMLRCEQERSSMFMLLGLGGKIPQHLLTDSVMLYI